MALLSLNDMAKTLRQLCKPGDPVVLTNVYDGASASAVIAHPSTKAVATASYAVAAVAGVSDPELDLETNLEGIRIIATVLNKTDIPLTADLQDGYDDIGDTIQQAIKLGVVGGNIEDVDNKSDKLRDVEDAVSRIKTALSAAKDAGVPDFCLNARTDALGFGGSINDAISRGKAYLDAGATTVYVWGGPTGRGVSRDEIKELVKALGGMINVKMNLRPGFLNVQEIADLGVARISVGPEMWVKAMAGFKDALETIAQRESFT